MNVLEEAKKVFDIEIAALKKTQENLNGTFEKILNEIVSCEGKIVMVGMGKPGHISKKIAATFSSLGTPSLYLNPAEALHGDLGMISKNDVVIIISYSGESDEVINIIPSIKLIGAKIIAITANSDSRLAKYANITEILPKFTEACHLGLAPTSSTTVELCYGDALAVVASEWYGFKDTDFGKFHPAGALGKKILLKVEDLMFAGTDNAIVELDANLTEVVCLLSYKKLGLVSVLDKEGLLAGVITTGDLGRQLEKKADIYSLKAMDVMTSNPITIEKNKLAMEALNLMKNHNIYSLPVIENNKPIGTINMQAILRVGMVGEISEQG